MARPRTKKRKQRRDQTKSIVRVISLDDLDNVQGGDACCSRAIPTVCSFKQPGGGGFSMPDDI